MRVALALASTALAVVAFVPAAGASSSAHNGRIAFAYLGSADRFLIYTVTPAGAKPRKLTPGRRYSSRSPAYSPSGKQIVFVRASKQRDLWTMNADGSAKRRLTWTKAIDEVDPAWSPDGARIAFAVHSPTAKAGIWVVDAEGRHRRQLTSSEAYNPSWSPDATAIAFGAAGVIWTIAASGGTPTQVTFPGTYADGTPYSDFDPAWSPDGSRIVFSSDRGDPPESADQIDLWILDLASASPTPNVTQLTNSPSRDERDPAWSPDGSKVAYDTTGTFHGASSAQLGIIASNGTGPHFITHSCGDCAYFNGEPSWQPLR